MSRHAFDQYVFVMGEVPSAETAPTTTVTLFRPYTQAGLPYPSGIGMNETTLTNVIGGTTGDVIRVWDIPTQEYVPFFFDSSGTNGGGWQPVDAPGTATTYRFHIGEAFYFVHSNLVGSTSWVESKPYTWP
jgi:hypothetical protein